MSDSRELAFAKRLAYEAGKIMKQHFRSDSITTTWKADATPLTVADTTINKLVLDAVGTEFPDHAFAGEEGANDKTSEYRWVCDPVDGTIPYSMGVPTSTFTLALAHHGEVQAGVVYDPFCDRLYWSQKGHGAYRNNARLTLPPQLPHARVAVDLELWSGGRAAFLEAYEHQSNNLSITLGAASYGGMLVASGELQGLLHSGRYPWDTAALSLIIAEAGGKVSDLTGKKLDYSGSVDGFIGAHPAVYDELLRVCQRLGPTIGRSQ